MDDVRDGEEPEAAWEQVATGFAELGDLLRSGIKDLEEEGSRDDLRRAWNGFVTAAQGLGQALATTVNDPEIRAGAKRAFGSLVDAIGTSVRDAAAETAARTRPGRRTEGRQTSG